MRIERRFLLLYKSACSPTSSSDLSCVSSTLLRDERMTKHLKDRLVALKPNGGIVFGSRKVLKKIQSKAPSVCMVVVSRCPKALMDCIAGICAVKGIPAVSIQSNSKQFGHMFGLRSCMALAIHSDLLCRIEDVFNLASIPSCPQVLRSNAVQAAVLGDSDK